MLAWSRRRERALAFRVIFNVSAFSVGRRTGWNGEKTIVEVATMADVFGQPCFPFFLCNNKRLCFFPS